MRTPVDIPSYLKKQKPSQGERIRITRYNGNWPALHKNLLVGDEDPEAVLKIMWVEIHRPQPREGVLRRLLSRYSSLKRKHMTEELLQFMSENIIKYSVSTK